jgi:hypothetical protein
MKELLKTYRETKLAWETSKSETKSARDIWCDKLSEEYRAQAAYWSAVDAINAADLSSQ